MNGMEFFERLREIKNSRKSKVIFCTTENEIEKIMEAIDAGADEYIMKPFDKAILADKLTEVGLLK
jgi:two-component system chemotaxis response regulator CheY